MNNCIGIMGKLFGHKYESVILERCPDYNFIGDGKINLYGYPKNIYAVICKRCGRRLETKDEKNKKPSSPRYYDHLALILYFGDLHYRAAKTDDPQIKDTLHNEIQAIWEKIVEKTKEASDE